MENAAYDLIPLGLLAVLWVVFILLYRHEPRRLGLAVVLLPLVLITLGTITELFTSLVPGAGYFIGIVLVLMPLMVIIFGGVLIYNGVLMWRREGARLQNLLSLVIGVLVFVLPVTAVGLIWIDRWWSYALAFILFMASVFTATLFSMFLLYAWIHALFPAKGKAKAVVVLGARAINGKVTPLLRGRLDKAIALAEKHSEPKPLLVPSGGQGADEVEPEGVSMARYLREQGLEDDEILVEDRSKNTVENLRFSAELVRERVGEGRLWIVTSNYHALRAALASKKAGLDARAFGGKTARYYLPSAFLRECIAMARDHVKLIVLLSLPYALVLATMLMYSVNANL